MKRRRPSILGVVARGLAVGSIVGALHALALGAGGLYATTPPLVVLLSAARYVALMALVAAALALAGELLLAGLRAFRPAGFLGAYPGATTFLAVYLAGWALLFVRATRDRLLPAVVGAALLVAMASGLLLWAWRSVRRPPRTPVRGAMRPVAAWLVAATVGVHVALLFATSGGMASARRFGADDRDATGPPPAWLDPAPPVTTPGSPPPEPRRNLLLLTFDTLRADHMGCYGYPRNTTPELDSLAVSGVRFSNVLCQRPKTSPSVATILTGTYPVTHGIHAPMQVLTSDNLTLAEILQREGWITGAVITNGNLYPQFGFDQGFASYAFGHKDAATGSDRALEWLQREATAERPWFLWVHHTDPHWPYEPDPPFDELFGQGSAEPRRAQRYVDLYDGEIRYTDFHAGRILRWLRDRPAVRDRTLVVFTADHGESLGEHGYYWEHGLHPYEPSARIPLLLSLPGVIPPVRVAEAMGGAVDIVPSVLALLGVSAPDGLQGSSLADLARGGGQGSREFVFLEAGYSEHVGPGRTQALRRPDSKYVMRLKDWALFPQSPLDLPWTMDACMEGGLAPDELYDLAADPGETENLLRAEPVRASEERALLRAFVSHLAGQVRGGRALDPAQLDEATYESLKSLGYVD